MTNDVPQRSAKIYQFPVRARVATGNHDEIGADFHSQRVANVVGSSWYHDAAIEESKRTREH